jgi:hypothetical protein
MKCWPLLDCVRRGADLEQSLRPAALAYRVLAPHPDSVATRLSLHTLRLRKTPGRPWGHSPARECGRFRIRRRSASTLPLAVLLTEPGERRVARRRYRARDRRHEGTGNATAAYSRTPCLRDHRMRHKAKILVVEDSLPAGRHDRRSAARPRPEAGRSTSYDDNEGRTLRSRCSTSWLAYGLER